MSAEQTIPDAREIAEALIDQCEGCSCDECTANVSRIVSRAIMAERERAAKIADQYGNEHGGSWKADAAVDIAAAIRNGG